MLHFEKSVNSDKNICKSLIVDIFSYLGPQLFLKLYVHFCAVFTE